MKRANQYKKPHKRSSGFYGVLKQKDGSYRTQQLVKAAHIPVQRHIKVKTEANPFDPKWERYFEKRLDAKMMAHWRGQRSLLHLWRSQDDLCPICRGEITKETGWENHHLCLQGQWRAGYIGNFHIRFLGGGGLATVRCYPTGLVR